MGRRPREEPAPETRRRSDVVPNVPGPPTEHLDVYQRVIDYEEAEAKGRSAESDADLFFSTCESLRQLFKQVNDLKSNNSKSNQDVMNEARLKASVMVVTLKKLNRLEKIRTKAGRDTLHKEKLKLDSMHLLLQNLLYEANHLDKEVTKCLQFKSKDEEIDLVTVDDFYKGAPDDVSRPKVTKSNDHQLRLARLEWELRQRRELSDACAQLQESARKVTLSLTEARARLNGLTPQLRNALVAAEPLQEALGLQPTKSRAAQGVALLLPSPLFLLHARTLAYAEAFGHHLVQVSISGDEEEARQFEQINALPDISSDTDSDADADGKEEEYNQVKKKRHHRGSNKITKKDKAEEKIKLVTKVHPLKVHLKIKFKETTLTLTFSYLMHLKIVTVQGNLEMGKIVSGVSSGDVLNCQSILQGLYPGDIGSDSPHPATSYILRSAGIEESFSRFIQQLGRPYIWAQRMCGLDFMEMPVPKSYNKLNIKTSQEPCPKLSSASVENVLIILKKNLKARMNLVTELQELESGNLPPFEGAGSSHVRLMGSLTIWQAITWAEYSQPASTNQFITSGVVSQSDMFYRAIITRQSAKLVALVALKNDYPKQAPIFSLTLHWNGTHHAKTDDDIRDVERCVNTDWCLSDDQQKKKITLAGQITRLIACLDILLEAVGSSEFPPEKVMFRAVKGRNRVKPYKFLKHGSGVFVQY